MHIGFWCGNPREKRPLGKRRRKWDNTIKMELQVVGWMHGID